MNIILLGPPGAGKGSLATLLKDSLEIAHISTGDILREEMKNDTPLGTEAKTYIEKGELVPDELVTRLIENKLSNLGDDSKGYLLDGYPRTTTQAEDLDKILEKLSIALDRVLYMEATLGVIVRRLTGRRVCRNCGSLFHVKNKPPQKEDVCDVCGDELYVRRDDNEETIKTRMNVYIESTEPIVKFYEAQNKLEKIDGDEHTEDLHRELLKTWNESNATD